LHLDATTKQGPKGVLNGFHVKAFALRSKTSQPSGEFVRVVN